MTPGAFIDPMDPLVLDPEDGRAVPVAEEVANERASAAFSCALWLSTEHNQNPHLNNQRMTQARSAQGKVKRTHRWAPYQQPRRRTRGSTALDLDMAVVNSLTEACVTRGLSASELGQLARLSDAEAILETLMRASKARVLGTDELREMLQSVSSVWVLTGFTALFPR